MPEEPSDKTSSPGPSPRHTQPVHPAQTGRTASAALAQGVQSPPSPARQTAPATAIRDIRTRLQALSGQSEPPRPSLAESAARHSISVSAPLIAFSPWFDRAQHPQGTDAFSPAKMLLSGPADPQQALSGPANLQAPSGSTASPNFQESIPLTYGAVRTSEPPSEQAAGSSPAQPESEFARSLPDWARNFLRNNTAASRAAPSAAAVHPSISPSAAQQPIQWTAPNYRPADPPIAYREKNKEEPVREKREASISEAQLQRTADRIYQIIEDRIRRERRRLGL